MNETIRILLVDDHTMVRKGLESLLQDEADAEIVAEAADGTEAVRLVSETKPDIVLMDIAMPEMSGLEATRIIKKNAPDVRVLALSMYERKEYLRQAVAAGADGYILKGDPPETLMSAIRDVAGGRAFFSPSFSSDLIAEVMAPGPKRDSRALTSRERQVLQLIADGKSNRIIATDLDISPRTVAVHRMNLMKKLEVHNAPSLLRRAEEEGLIHPRV